MPAPSPPPASTPKLLKAPEVVRLTPSEWHAMLEDRSFLDRSDNQLRPRRLAGAPVQIIPDDSYR